MIIQKFDRCNKGVLVRFFSIISIVYLLILGINIGSIIACGAFSAPVIFHTDTLLPELGMTKFDMGIVMTKIFLKLNTLLNVTAIIIIIYELSSFNFKRKKDFFALVIGAINIILIFIFTLGYTRSIIEAQSQGAAATATPEFYSIHHQSEIVFQFLFISLSIGFIWNAIQLYKNQNYCLEKSLHNKHQGKK